MRGSSTIPAVRFESTRSLLGVKLCRSLDCPSGVRLRADVEPSGWAALTLSLGSIHGQLNVHDAPKPRRLVWSKI